MAHITSQESTLPLHQPRVLLLQVFQLGVCDLCGRMHQELGKAETKVRNCVLLGWCFCFLGFGSCRLWGFRVLGVSVLGLEDGAIALAGCFAREWLWGKRANGAVLKWNWATLCGDGMAAFEVLYHLGLVHSMVSTEEYGYPLACHLPLVCLWLSDILGGSLKRPGTLHPRLTWYEVLIST